MSASFAALRHIPPMDREPRGALLAVADGLTAYGFDVGGPAWEQSQRLSVTNVRGARCELDIRDDGHLTWEYRPCHGTHADPAHAVDMVTAILGAGGQRGGAVARYPGLTFKGVVGRALAGRGMTVRLVTLQHDDVAYDLYAEIEVTHPADPARGRVRVTDHAAVRWDCRYGTPTGTGALGPSEIADIIASALAAQIA